MPLERDTEARLHVSRFQQKILAQVNRGAAPVFSDGAVKSIKKERGRELDNNDALLGKYEKKITKFVEIPIEARTAIE